MCIGKWCANGINRYTQAKHRQMNKYNLAATLYLKTTKKQILVVYASDCDCILPLIKNVYRSSYSLSFA